MVVDQRGRGQSSLCAANLPSVPGAWTAWVLGPVYFGLTFKGQFLFLMCPILIQWMF